MIVNALLHIIHVYKLPLGLVVPSHLEHLTGHKGQVSHAYY